MKNFKILTPAERTTVQTFLDDLRDHAAALERLLTVGYTADVYRMVNDRTDGYHHAYGPTSRDLPAIVERLKEGRCPECDGTAEYCDCND